MGDLRDMLAGTKVTCPNKHPICEAVETIMIGDLGWHRKFGNWKIDPPQVGTPSAELLCPTCGENWFYEMNRNLRS